MKQTFIVALLGGIVGGVAVFALMSLFWRPQADIPTRGSPGAAGKSEDRSATTASQQSVEPRREPGGNPREEPPRGIASGGPSPGTAETVRPPESNDGGKVVSNSAPAEFPFDLSPEVQEFALKGDTNGAVAAYSTRISATKGRDAQALKIRLAAFLVSIGKADEADASLSGVDQKQIEADELALLERVRGWIARQRDLQSKGK